MKKNYCAYVEKGIRIKLFEYNNDIYADIKPCCHITAQYIPQDIKKPVLINSAVDIFKSRPLKYFRKYFKRNNDLPLACIACDNHERKSLQSPREKINKLDYTDYDINKLDVVLGNSCNLACPFCSSYASSLIDKLSNKLSTNERPQSWIPLVNERSRGTNKTADVIKDLLSTYKVHTLKLIGGEPFLKENWDKIAEVIDTGRCKDMHLEVTTNGTILNDEIFSRLSKTKHAHLRISVDSIDSNYEFIRWPHKWDKMHKNLDYLRNNTYENIHISVSNLVNIFNFEYLPKIEEYFLDVKNVVGYSTEIKPDTHLMNYQNLPEHIIESVKDRIKSKNLKQALVKGNNNYSKEILKKEFEVLIAQRKMSAEDVIGPMTREWLGL